MLYREFISKCRFNTEKIKVLHIIFQNIKVEYNKRQRNKIFKKGIKECDVEVGFDIFKALNHILSILSRANKMLEWMVWKFISRDTDIVLKILNIVLKSGSYFWDTEIRWFGLVSLFNGISTFVGYLMPKLFS